jgi:hypothetical protein
MNGYVVSLNDTSSISSIFESGAQTSCTNSAVSAVAGTSLQPIAPPRCRRARAYRGDRSVTNLYQTITLTQPCTVSVQG